MVSKSLLILLLFLNCCYGITVQEFLTLTTKQKRVLDELRKRVDKFLVKDYTKEDQFLVRWLRETDFNLEASERLILDNLRWRKENKIDDILKEDFSDLDAEYKIFMEGCDKEGMPIMTLPFGDWDIRLAVISGQSERLVRYVYFMTEYCIGIMLKMQARGENVTHINSVLDMDNINAVQHMCPLCVPVYLQIIIGYQTRFPGYLNKGIGLNTPEFFIPVWNAVKQILSPKFRDIFFVYGRNKEDWKKKMLENVWDASAVSRKYGGVRESGLDLAVLRKVIKEKRAIYSCNLLPADLLKLEPLESEEIGN